MNHDKKLSNSLMIIVELYLKLCTKKYREGLKILTPKQMFQRLSIALAQVKAGITSKNILNEIRRIIYYLYWEKKLIKKYKQYNEFSKAINQNEDYIYEFWE